MIFFLIEGVISNLRTNDFQDSVKKSDPESPDYLRKEMFWLFDIFH